jgi:hypothetical protein
MSIVACPSCGAALEFRSKLTLFRVCESCGSAVVRTDLKIEAIGKMADLPEDLSVIQLGTSGVFRGKRFLVLGRMRVAYDQGQWNEWYLSFSDGRDGWLAEAQGEFMVSFTVPVDPNEARSGSKLVAGSTLTFKGSAPWRITDRRVVSVVASEGELPIEAAAGRKGLSIDLGRAGGEFATLELSDTDAPRLYVGNYLSFEALELKDIRRIEGWVY